VRVTPDVQEQHRWWISPAIPTIGNLALSLLWAFSAFGGWGITAFCRPTRGPAIGRAGRAEQVGQAGQLADAVGQALDVECQTGFRTTVAVSVPMAVLAAVIGVAAWTVPSVRRRPELMGGTLVVAALIWLIAEAVLFGGGWLVQT
jgi:hypothetical protein